MTMTLVLAIIAACHSSQSKRSFTDLSERIGQRVHLEGRFGGPGKLADYAMVDDQQAYLTGDVDLHDIAYGSPIAVDGVLGFRKIPSGTNADASRPVGRPPDHFYYIENATVREFRKGNASPPQARP
jgi:hypothetical protein